MTNRCLWLTAWILIIPAVVAAKGMPTAGERLTGINLQAPDTADQRAYLGLSAVETFEPTAVTGRLLVIQIFSMYCPHCQREAPAVNRLYESIQGTQGLRDRVKMIGIGVGNSAFEVDHFRKHYQIEFPLFPDPDFVIHKHVGEVRTPFFIIMVTDGQDKGRILWTGAGKMDPLDTFMDRLNGFVTPD